MVTHEIIVSREKKHHIQSKTFQGKHGSTEHRQFILQRAWQHNPFKMWDTVVFRRKRYEIIDIYSDYSKAAWKGLKPFFIELWDGNGDPFLVHPGDIKKAR